MAMETISMDSSKATTHNAGDMVVSDHGRSVYVTGHYYEINSSTGITSGSHSGYVKKLDAKGNRLWNWNNTTTQTSVGGGFVPTAIALDPQQNDSSRLLFLIRPERQHHFWENYL